MSRTIPTVYELAPIGVDRALEAIHAYGFCSNACREAFEQQHHAMITASGQESPNDFADGHHCDQCGTPLEVQP